MLRHELVTEYEQFVKLRNTWNKLLKGSTSKAKVYLDHDWMNSWYKYFQNPVSLFIILVYEEQELIAIAPFCLALRRRFGLSGNAVSFMGISLADYCDIICDSAYSDKHSVYQYIFDVLWLNKRKWSLVHLDEIPHESEIFKYTPIPATGYGLSTCSTCGYVDTSASWGEYERAIMPKGIRQKRRRLEELGDVTFARVTKAEDVAPFMDELFTVHIARWRGTESESRFTEENQRLYFKDVATTLFPRGLLDLSYLSVGGRKAAFHFGFRDEERLHIYLHTFNPQFGKYSLGHMLLYHLIKNSYDSFKYIDFLRGSESYKRHFKLTDSYNYSFGYYKSNLHQWLHTKLSSNPIEMTDSSTLIGQDHVG
jgi:CelD/BcsL family acetyltransferase involved in cellulose biosynthesis